MAAAVRAAARVGERESGRERARERDREERESQMMKDLHERARATSRTSAASLDAIMALSLCSSWRSASSLAATVGGEDWLCACARVFDCVVRVCVCACVRVRVHVCA